MEMRSSDGLVIGAALGLVMGATFENAEVGLLFGVLVGLVLGPAFPSHNLPSQ